MENTRLEDAEGDGRIKLRWNLREICCENWRWVEVLKIVSSGGLLY
jgi:hypothetical protein